MPAIADATRSPGAGLSGNNLSVRWSGVIVPTRSGVTRLQTVSDDGVRLWVDGKLLIDDWTIHGTTTTEASIDLVAGRRHQILIQYFNQDGPGTFALNWMRPGDTAFTAIPLAQFDPPAAVFTENVAKGKSATQSSDFEGAVAARAVDGNTNGAYGAGSVSHTRSEANAWWQVDLGAQYAISRIRLWNRTDCCSDRLNNVDVFFSANDMTGRSNADLKADPNVGVRSIGVSRIPSNIDVLAGGQARYVRVQLSGTNFLQLAEVEVFGKATNRAPTFAPMADVTANVGAAVSITPVATDLDGDTLAYTASGLPAGLSIAPSTGVVSGTVTAAGTSTATITATDPSASRPPRRCASRSPTTRRPSRS